MEIEVFGSEAEAAAFVRGMETAIELLDDGEIWVNPVIEHRRYGEWVVTYAPGRATTC